MWNRLLIVTIVAVAFVKPSTAETPSSPNVLVISIDDLNDWVGCLEGHPNARTPNIDRLAQRGTLFANTHCQAPICTPSRASLVLGKYPSTTGMYFLQPPLTAYKDLRPGEMIVQHFADAGYLTMGVGKFVHGGNEARWFQKHGGSMGGFGPKPPEKINLKQGHALWDWGAYPEHESDAPDAKVAAWVAKQIAETDSERPFFLVAGFWRPHVPMYAPQKYIDMFPLDDINLPETRGNDRNDLSQYAKDLTIGLPAPRHEWFLENDQWKTAVACYLASVAFVDTQVGRVLDALDASPHADNTVIVLFSDHGWHLGEKQRWAKRSLWEDGIRVPMIIAATKTHQLNATVTRQPTGLIDIYPTLLELVGLPPKTDLEGRSLLPLMKNPNAKWDRPVLCTFAPHNHSLRSRDYHYIHYADGSEELYDMRVDPHEFDNLADQSKYAPVLTEFRRRLPTTDATPIRSDWSNWEIEAWQTAESRAGKK